MPEPSRPSRTIACLAVALGSSAPRAVRDGFSRCRSSQASRPASRSCGKTHRIFRWRSQLLSRLSERQWRDAFRAAQYDDQHAARYISKIKQKTDKVWRCAGRQRPEAPLSATRPGNLDVMNTIQ